MMTFRESIRPSADLRNHYNEISRQCRENKEAVVITVNGNSVTSGSSVTWAEGTNTVAVTVINGGSRRTYTIIVTRED
jgi:hypothetical protein